MEQIENRRRAEQIVEAKFDPRLKTYTIVGVSLVLLITVIGIILLPFWLIFGRSYVNRDSKIVILLIF
ncbi:MAG: hypothetical protein WD607_03855 [Candidatus Paceibacterota bacterium]